MDVTQIRREPPRFRHTTVVGTNPLTPHMIRVTLGGDDLAGFHIDEPAASVRILLPSGDDLVIPTWTGNEFLLPGGERPTIRTFTPRHFRPDERELDVDIVVHGSGAASDWATKARPGDPAAISGPGRGYRIDPTATAYVLAGDETAIPAICQLLEVLPGVPITVHVEVAHDDARLDLHRTVTELWHTLVAGSPPGATLLPAIRSTELPTGARIWAAGEAAAMQHIRKHLFDERDVPRSHATVRGYWKHDRAG